MPFGKEVLWIKSFYHSKNKFIVKIFNKENASVHFIIILFLFFSWKRSSFFSVAKIPDTLDIYEYIDYISVKYQGISTDYPYSGQNVFRWSWFSVHEAYIFSFYNDTAKFGQKFEGSLTTIRKTEHHGRGFSNKLGRTESGVYEDLVHFHIKVKAIFTWV